MPAKTERQIATARFGLGASPSALAAVDDARAWLHAQIEAPAAVPPALAGLPTTPDYRRRFREWQLSQKKATSMDARNAVPGFRRTFAADFEAETLGLALQQIQSPAPLTERLVMFWSNHFAVSADKLTMALLPGAYQREAIRPHLTARFETLLLAAVRHPAMLYYLDNWRSVGPNSRAARRRQKQSEAMAGGGDPRVGINENLAREILELHTLGVNGGYRQDDVIELARGISGWSVGKASDRSEAGYQFRPGAHEPGKRRLLGRDYADDGEEQGLAMLRDLARHPNTARFVCHKLARHFVADEPPASLLRRLEQAWQRSGGQLGPVYAALVDAPESWQATPRKFKRPDEFLVSALRATELPPPPRGHAWSAALTLLGQPPFRPGSPAGWADGADSWIAPDGLWKRVEVAQQIAARVPGRADPAALAEAALGPWLQDDTRLALGRAESRQQAIALLLASPEFQWR